jgi:hypothetical protein
VNLSALREIAKALAAFFSALAAGLAAGASTADGLNAGGTLVALVGAVASGLLTFSVPNAKPTGARRIDDVALPPDSPAP